MNQPIPVIDLFAGPGGLGEGFSSLKIEGRNIFKLALSIEKDESAYQTLLLRAIYRGFEGKVPDLYYDYITGKISKQEFLTSPAINNELVKALVEAQNLTLGQAPPNHIDISIKSGIAGCANWVLIGGPPCQAYSLAGRSKMMKLNLTKYESDSRHLLYNEYLRIIKKHSPPVFIMENVKGILSSKFNGELIFKKIINDLSNPNKNLEYEIRSLAVQPPCEELKPKDFIIHSERYGLPQSRHRVILFGIRKDLAKKKHNTLVEADLLVSVDDVINNLPKIRSRLSKEKDSMQAWCNAIESTKTKLDGWNGPLKNALVDEMKRNSKTALGILDCGDDFLPGENTSFSNAKLKDWFYDVRLSGVIQHKSRSHMRSDIQRYFFLANYAKVLGRSPKICELPSKLLPDHQNADTVNAPFQDRFRVQLGNRPSTTIVSHISKDGHYYIHPDPSQSRSLTVREAARLQTFPDNYFFEGNKTSQYTQVGNAVPPLLANQIAKIIAEFLR